MPALRVTTTVAAPPRTVAGVLRDTDVVAAALGRCGHRVAADARWLAPGSEVRFGIRVLPGVRVPVRSLVTAMSAGGMASALVRGPLAHVVTVTAEGGGTRMVDELRWRGPVPRGPFRRLLAARAAEVTAAAEALAAAPVVVATALVRDGRVLAAQRTRPPALAGRWELPGGRVEAGESEAAAAVRECREELGTEVVVDGRLGTDLRIDAGVLRVHTARLAPGAPEPVALEHSALRWVGAEEVAAVGWVDADRAVVADLVALLCVHDRTG